MKEESSQNEAMIITQQNFCDGICVSVVLRLMFGQHGLLTFL